MSWIAAVMHSIECEIAKAQNRQPLDFETICELEPTENGFGWAKFASAIEEHINDSRTTKAFMPTNGARRGGLPHQQRED